MNEPSTPTQLNMNFKHAMLPDGRGGMMPGLYMASEMDFDLLAAEFTARDSDTFLVAYPKCGTTWLRQIVHLLRQGGEQGELGINQTMFYVEVGDAGLPTHLGNLAAMTERRYLTTHLNYALMPGGFNPKARYLYVTRNPKDCAVSYYYFSVSNPYIAFEGTWDEYFELFINGLALWGSYFDHVREWWLASQQSNNILFLTYEQMHQDLPGAVAQIADFIDLPLTPAIQEKVVAQSRFRAMQENPKTNQEDWVTPQPGRPFHHFMRKGEIGDWRNHFSPEQNARIDAVYQEKLVSVGLELCFDLPEPSTQDIRGFNRI